MGKLSLALGLGVGYVLGTRAGRAQYEQIQQAAARLTARPEVQDAVGKVRDSLPTPLQGTVDGLVKKAGGSGSASGKSTPAPGPVTTGSFPMEDDEVVMAQTYSAMTERSVDAPQTEDLGRDTVAPVNPYAADDEPVAQTFSAYTERTADEPATEHTR
jgi:hypothetical protein